MSSGFVETMGSQESKRQFIDRLFQQLEKHPKGSQFLLDMARALVEQREFPDLVSWEDSEAKISRAKKAVAALAANLAAGGADVGAEGRRRRAVAQETALSSARQQETARLAALKERLSSIAVEMGSQRAGYDFQDWFYDLMALQEVLARPPYVSDGRQVDGTITVDGTTYLVELKFTSNQADATDIDSLAHKVTRMADNTMGAMISMSGYSAPAIATASGPGTKLILMDYIHVMSVLDGSDFSEIVRRSRRHASQTGNAFFR